MCVNLFNKLCDDVKESKFAYDFREREKVLSEVEKIETGFCTEVKNSKSI